MLFKSNLSIRKEVFYIGLIFSVITLLVFGLFFSNYLSNANIEQAKKTINERNKQISIFTEGVFNEITNTINALSGNQDIINANIDQQHKERALAIYKDLFEANSNITYIYSGYEDGYLLINDYEAPPDFDSTNRPWYISAIESSPEQAIGFPYQDASTDEWVIFQSKALFDEWGERMGVISIDLSLGKIAAMLDEGQLYDSQHSFVMNKKGEIIIHFNEDMLGQVIPEIVEGFTAQQGELIYTVENATYWAHYNTIETTGWFIITAVERWDVLMPIMNSILVYILVVIILATVLGVIQSKIIGKRLAEPIIALGERVANITSGKSTENVRSYQHSNNEISMIANNIEQLAEHSLQKKKNELTTIIESTQDGILVVDDNRNVIYVNTRFKEMWHIQEDTEELIDDQKIIDSIIHQLDDPQVFTKKIEELYNSYCNDLDTLTFKDGRVYERFTRPLLDKQQLMGRLWSFRDVTEQKRAEEKLQKMATTDELTGLWNRRYFMNVARKEFGRAKRYGHHFSLLSIDLDYFKRVNDTLGHAAGDMTLQHLAELLKKVLRDVDIPGRLGGEEFGVLLPGISMEDAVLVAERLRLAIENNPAHYEGKDIQFTASIGVTTYRKEVASIDDIFKEADEALYIAKEEGRNRTVNYLHAK